MILLRLNRVKAATATEVNDLVDDDRVETILTKSVNVLDARERECERERGGKKEG